MRDRFRFTLRARRNFHDALIQCLDRRNTVNTDSVFGFPPGTLLMSMIRATTGTGVIVLQFSVRSSWRLESGDGMSFQVYKTAAFKYWLRSLIRRCR
jgi:hypothetical protein